MALGNIASPFAREVNFVNIYPWMVWSYFRKITPSGGVNHYSYVLEVIISQIADKTTEKRMKITLEKEFDLDAPDEEINDGVGEGLNPEEVTQDLGDLDTDNLFVVKEIIYPVITFTQARNDHETRVTSFEYELLHTKVKFNGKIQIEFSGRRDPQLYLEGETYKSDQNSIEILLCYMLVYDRFVLDV